jgi:chitinase
MLPMTYTLNLSTDIAAELADYPLVFLAFLHVDSTGGLSLNNSPISPGSDPDLLAGIQAMTAGGTFVLLSIGGSSSDGDYQNIIANYDTFLSNLTALLSAYGIAGIDLDLEAETHPYSDYRLHPAGR